VPTAPVFARRVVGGQARCRQPSEGIATPTWDDRVVPLYALNLFDLADNEDYRAYSRRSADAVHKHKGKVVALGRHQEHPAELGPDEPRQALVLVEWASREAFEGFLNDPELTDLHPLRENGTRRYIWWTFERLEDLRPLLGTRPG